MGWGGVGWGGWGSMGWAGVESGTSCRLPSLLLTKGPMEGMASPSPGRWLLLCDPLLDLLAAILWDRTWDLLLLKVGWVPGRRTVCW